MRRVGDRAGELKRLLSLLCNHHGGNGDIVLAGADAGEDASPGQDFLFDLERRIFAQIFDQLVVEARRLAVLDELEGTEIVFGRHDEATLLDLLEARGFRVAGHHRHREQRGHRAEHQAARHGIGVSD
ncbi:hypothetical protein GALL_523280 [mine drainage metagenome]|uniref:Uncharacterized protein n=1 Tax=mine drainage metagenome TaxID=410659 RepID=A0A1J5PLE8_9ZZZZ